MKHKPNFRIRLVSAAIAVAITQLACVASPPAPPKSEPIIGTIFQGGDYSNAQENAAPSAAGAAAGVVATPLDAVSGKQRDAEPGTQPRIIRGNDQVIASPKRVARVSGPANTFKFEDAPVAEVANVILRDVVGVDYVLHTPLNGTVTLATRGRVSADEAMVLLESALQANGMVLARDSRGVYHVGRPESLRGVVAAPRVVGKGPLPPGYGAVIVPLQYIGAPDMAAILKPLLPPEALVRVDTVRNLLVLVGTRSQAEGWLDLVNTFDVDLLKGMSVGVFPLKHASVREVQEALAAVTGGGAGGGGPAAPGGAPQPPAGAPGAPAGPSALQVPSALFGALRILPIERLNSILVVTPRASYLETAREWIERLDQPSGNSKEPELHVYEVQNGSARHLAEVLNGIFGGQGQGAAAGGTGIAPGLGGGLVSTGFGGAVPVGSIGTGGIAYQGLATSGFGGVGGFGGSGFGGGFGATAGGAFGQSPQQGTAGARSTGVTAVNIGPNVRVVADGLNNAVLVYSNAADYKRIEATLKRLDIAATQVLIEASIIEVKLNNELQYGLQWAFNDSARNGLSGRGVLSNIGGGTLAGPAAGFSYTLRASPFDVRAVLNLLADKSLIKVISSPSLMVLDNHTATIGVGDQQPIQSGTTVTTGGVITTAIQYKDTGVQLAVTPSVTAGNIVTMQLNQAVTDVGDRDAATGQRSFQQRQINSKVAVRSGQTLVLGGLIRDRSSTGKVGIPVLQDIPVVGSLFGTTATESDRTELIVVITPRVVRSDQEARDVGIEMRDRMKSFKALEERDRPTPAATESGEPAVMLKPPSGSMQ